jgi:hypothetical protein
MANIFDTLLTEIDETDRVTLKEIAERNPKLANYIADPADVSQVERTKTWYANNWDFEHNCTKEEHARQLRIDALQAQVAAAGEKEMTLEQLNQFLDDRAKDGKVVSAATMKEEINNIVKAKETEFNYGMNRVAALATVVPYLNQLHQRDLGELFDPEDLLTKANAEYQERLKVDPNAQPRDLKDFYLNSYSATARAEKATAKAAADKVAHDAELTAAREEGRKAALQDQAGQTRAMPSADSGSDIGYLQMKLMNKGTEVPAVGEVKADVSKVDIGRGSIAAIRAAEGDRREIQGNAA